MSFSSSVDQDKNTDAYLEKRDLGSTKNLFHKFNPSAVSILGDILQAQFELLDQMKESNHGSNLHSESFESLMSLKSEPYKSPFKDVYEQSAKEITHPRRLLQSETNFINVLQENIGIGKIWENTMGEEVSFGESGNGKDENESKFEEGEENESGSSELDAGGPGNGETGEGDGDGDGNGEGKGETNEDAEDPWLGGEVCFEGQSSDGEMIIVEGQQSEIESHESDMLKLLASYIDFAIPIDIVQVQQNIEELEVNYFPITHYNPGDQNCHTQTICRYVNLPRLGKRCICRQQVVCLH